jgi:acyl-CoA synthetase (AMP-forming)/AMP-acid ligase II
MSPVAFLRQPVRWLRAISEHGGTLSPAPNFAYGLCVRRVPQSEREGLDLSTWRLAGNGAELVNVQTLHEFERTYAPYGFRATAAFPVYGLAEATLSVAFSRAGAPVRHETVDRAQLGAGRAVVAPAGAASTTLVSVGTAVPGHEVRVVDDRGTPCPELTVGEILVRGPSVMQGYFRDPEATARTIVDGWLHTGDLGYVADGALYIAGRAKDLIIVRGRNVYPEDVERSAEGVSGVRGGGAVAFGVYDEAAAEERVVLVCETKVADDVERAAIGEHVRRLVQDAHEVTVHDVRLVAPGTIPKTSSGKRQRSRCRELYERGTLDRARPDAWRRAAILVRGGLGLSVMRVRRWLRRG